MSSLLQLLALSATVAAVLAECVTRLRSDGIGSIVGHRLFSNGSVGVIDDFARYTIFDSAGVLFYKENLNLPNDPERSSSYRLIFAMMASNTGEVYLVASNDRTFTYSAGVVTQTNYYGGNIRLVVWGPFLNFQDFGVSLNTLGMLLWQTYLSKLYFLNILNPPYNAGYMFNNSYLSRASANPLLNEFYLALLSNKTFIGSVNPLAYNFVPDASTAASTVATEPLYYVITSSIGGNSQYIAFAGYYPWSATNKYDHYLTIKQRSNSATTSLQITNYHIWSVALDNTTATKMYFLTHDGSLYWTTFSTSSISAPTLLVQDVFLRYANLEILSSTQLLLKTLDSMSIFDITTSTLSIVVDIKPTGGRHFGSKMFVLTHNFNASLYELSGSMPVKDNSFSYIGKVRELIVSNSNNRFYLLTSSTLYTYSLTSYSQLASVNMAQLQIMMGATSIINFNDIAPMVFQPTKIILLVYGLSGSNLDSAMVVLKEVDLSYESHYWSGLFDNFLKVTVGSSFTSADYITLMRPDSLSVYYYIAPSTFYDPNYKAGTMFVATSDRPEIVNMKDVLYVSLPSGDKQPSRTDLQAGFVYEAETESNRPTASSRNSGSFFRWSYAAFTLVPNMMVQRLDGHLNKTMIFSGPMLMFIMYQDLNTCHQLGSEDFTGGVGYQKPDDSFIFFRGEYEVSKIDPLECYADPTKGYQNFQSPCYVADCQTCSAFYPNKCIICIAGKLPLSDLSACLSTCNPGYLLNGMCYNNCPIEYYKYNAAVNTCETELSCTVTNAKLIFGDMCNSVTSCPSGSTQNTSNYCTYPSTSSANLASTAVVANPCPTGQIYLQHYSLCVSNTNLFYANYTVSGTTMYCDGSTHYYDIASKRCLKTCGFYSGIHPQMGLICTTAATCISMGMFTDDTTSGVKLCTSTCSATLWANLNAKACLPACPNPSTYSQINDRTCITSCGATVFTLESNKSCLTSSECLTSSLVMTPSTKICSASCGPSLYLKDSSRECLTEAECTGSSHLLSLFDMKCVSACSPTQYLEQPSASCLSDIQCKAKNTGTGLMNTRDKTCVSNCPANLFILPSTQQCLTDTDCYSYGANTGLISSSDKKCVTACQASQYLLDGTRQCLTPSECRAHSSNTGLLSESDKKCTLACQSSQYLLQSTQQCLIASECLASSSLGGYLSDSDMKCQSACTATQYLISSSSKCVDETACWAQSYLVAPTSRLCEPSCLASEYMDSLSHICHTKAECSSLAMLTKTSSPNNLCVSTCSALEYKDGEEISCLTKPECTFGNGKHVITSNMTCVSSCPSDLHFTNDGECVASCPSNFFVEESVSKCVQHCAEAVSLLSPINCLRYLDFRIIAAEQASWESVVVILEVYFESNSTSTVTSFSVELATLFKQVGIVTDTSGKVIPVVAEIKLEILNSSQIKLQFATPVQLQPSFRVSISPDINIEFVANEFRSAFSETSKVADIALLPSTSLIKSESSNSTLAMIGKYSAQTLTAVKVLTPLMMTTFLDMQAGSFLCLIAQTYTKLMMLTHLNFKLEYNAYSVMYYDVFKEFLDNYNEVLMKGIVGTNIVSTNKQYVCDHGYDKLCYLTVEDNFFMSHMLALIISAVQALALYMLSQICRMLRFKAFGDLFTTKLKKVMLYSFILENSIEFWFTLLLNALIFVYRIAILSVMKIAGHLILLTFVVFLYKLLTRKSSSQNKISNSPNALEQGVITPSAPMVRMFENVFRRFRAIVKEITSDQAATGTLKCLLIHDWAFAMLLIPGRFLGEYQMAVWMAVEVVLLFLLSKYRPFSTWVLNMRQIVIEFLFLILLIIMTMVPHLKSSNNLLSMMIVILSLLILVIDTLFVVGQFIVVIIALLRSLFTKKEVSIKYSSSRSIATSYRSNFLGDSKMPIYRNNPSIKLRSAKTDKNIGLTILGTKDKSRTLKELATLQSESPRNRRIQSMRRPRAHSPSNRQISSPTPSMILSDSNIGDVSRVMQQVKSSSMRVKPSQVSPRSQPVASTIMMESSRFTEKMNPFRLRAKKFIV